MAMNPLIFKRSLKNVLLLFLGATLVVTLFSSVVVSVASLQMSKQEVDGIVNRMHENIRYKSGMWDLYYLNSDPLLPGSYTHYILTTQGYVIERWRPINGFIDTANLDHILQFSQPQTVTTPAQEQWRVLSQPVKNGNEVLGAVFVSRFVSETENISVIDKRLRQDLAFAMGKIRVVDDTIDTSALDMRQTQYDISIKIVDKYNTIIAKTNNSNSIDRAPNYIDSSYVRNELKSSRYRMIYDSVSNEPFLIVKSSFLNDNGEAVGVLIVGKSMLFLYKLVGVYLISMGLLTLITVPFVIYFYKKRYPGTGVRKIAFHHEEGILQIDTARIEIPLDTHQYHVLYCLFHSKDMQCSAEDITAAFGEHEGNIWRRVYDVMLVLNKKTEAYLDDKLIVIKNRRFHINPIFHTKITHL